MWISTLSSCHRFCITRTEVYHLIVLWYFYECSGVQRASQDYFVRIIYLFCVKCCKHKWTNPRENVREGKRERGSERGEGRMLLRQRTQAEDDQSQTYFLKKDLFLCVCAFCLHVCEFISCVPVSADIRRGQCISWSQNYRGLWAPMQVLGTELDPLEEQVLLTGALSLHEISREIILRILLLTKQPLILN